MTGLEHGQEAPATKTITYNRVVDRSEEHTSELQSQAYLVCRLLLEKKKHKHTHNHTQAQI